MKKRKSGSIINITSINAELGFPRNPSYVASKGGLKLLGKSLARDWGIHGIRVNNLGPGYIITEMTKKSYKNKKKISVIGFSMGGFIAIKLAIEYPEILDKLVLIGTNARNISQKRKLLLEKSLTTLSKDNFAKLFYQKNYSSYFSNKDLKNTSYQNTVYSMAKQLGYKTFLDQTNLILKRPNPVSYTHLTLPTTPYV